MTGTDRQRCIDLCLECYRVCNSTINGHCLEAGGDHLRPEHVRLMVDCAEICRTSADFMMRQSPRHQLTCGICADICAQCADDCERFGDDHMRQCAAVCRRCAESCQAMSGSAAR